MSDLAALLLAEGVRVREVGDWRSHVRPGRFRPEGNIVHHTADKGRGNSGLDVLRYGRGEPNPLNGPLCNGSPREDGSVVLLSAGIANHAGKGSGKVLERIRSGLPPLGGAGRLGLLDTVAGNGLFYGWEVDNDGVGQPYPAEQIDATVRCCAATSRFHGWGPERTILHSEWTRRKGDWSYCSGADLRDLVADRLRAHDEGDEPVALSQEDVERIAVRTAQHVANGQQRWGTDNLFRLATTQLGLLQRLVDGQTVTRAELDAALDELPAEVAAAVREALPA